MRCARRRLSPYSVLILNPCDFKSTADRVANDHPQDTYYALRVMMATYMCVTPGGTFRYMSIHFLTWILVYS